MKENVLLRWNDSIYGVQISLTLPQDKNEFTARNDYVMMASPLHATAWPVLSSEAGTKCFASILPLLEENACLLLGLALASLHASWSACMLLAGFISIRYKPCW